MEPLPQSSTLEQLATPQEVTTPQEVVIPQEVAVPKGVFTRRQFATLEAFVDHYTTFTSPLTHVRRRSLGPSEVCKTQGEFDSFFVELQRLVLQDGVAPVLKGGSVPAKSHYCMFYLLCINEKEQVQLVVGENKLKGFDFTLISVLFTVEHAPYLTADEPKSLMFLAPEVWRKMFHSFVSFYPRTSPEGGVLQVDLTGVPKEHTHEIMTECFDEAEMCEKSEKHARYKNSYYDITFLLPQ